MANKILVLTDGRQGNHKQSIALAQIMQWDYSCIALRFNILASLPNIIAPNMGIIENKTEIIKNNPDIIISAGRRAALIAVAYKNKYNRAVRIIQIMNPELCFDNFTTIILPKHDKKNRTYPQHILFIDGAISYNNTIEDGSFWFTKLRKIKKPIIGVFIGGKSKKCKFNKKHIDELIDYIICNKQALGAYVIISTSRRTENIEYIFGKVKHIEGIDFFDFQNDQRLNPYNAILLYSDYLVATGDSISMCSEAIATKKPLFVYAPVDFSMGKKHYNFIQNAVHNQLIKLTNEKLHKFTVNNNKDTVSIIRKEVSKLMNCP